MMILDSVRLFVLRSILCFFFVVRKSSKVSHIDSAAVLRPGVRAHTALFSYANVDSRSVVAVFSAASVSD